MVHDIYIYNLLKIFLTSLELHLGEVSLNMLTYGQKNGQKKERCFYYEIQNTMNSGNTAETLLCRATTTN